MKYEFHISGIWRRWWWCSMFIPNFLSLCNSLIFLHSIYHLHMKISSHLAKFCRFLCTLNWSLFNTYILSFLDGREWNQTHIYIIENFWWDILSFVLSDKSIQINLLLIPPRVDSHWVGVALEGFGDSCEIAAWKIIFDSDGNCTV